MKYPPGQKLKIVRCKDFPGLIGKIGTVMYHQDERTKIKLSFDQNWQGYFRPTEIEPFTETCRL